MTTRTGSQLRHAAAAMWVDDEKLLTALDNLNGRAFGQVIRSSTNKAMTPVLKKAKAYLKSKDVGDSGLLQESLGKKGYTSKRGGFQTVLVGPRSGFKRLVLRRGKWGDRLVRANPLNYAHLIEGGHRGRGRSRSGWTNARPFMAPALKTQKTQVTAEIRSLLGIGVLRIWDKASK